PPPGGGDPAAARPHAPPEARPGTLTRDGSLSGISRTRRATCPGWRRSQRRIRWAHHSTEDIAMFEKTVVGVDDRPGGRDALALAATLTAATAGELIAVRAYPHEGRPSRASG